MSGGQVQIAGGNPSYASQESGQYRYSDLSPEEALAQRAIARKQQIANILMTNGLGAAQTGGQMVGRFYVPPSLAQGFGGLGQILAGALASNALDEQGSTLDKDQRTARAQAVQDYVTKRSAQTAVQDPPTETPSNLESLISEANPSAAQAQQQAPPTLNPMQGGAPLQTGLQPNPFQAKVANAMMEAQGPGAPVPAFNPNVSAGPAPQTGQAEGPRPMMPVPPPAPVPTAYQPGTSTPGAVTMQGMNPADKSALDMQAALSDDPRLSKLGYHNLSASELEKERQAARETHTADLKYSLATMVANKQVTQDQANALLAQNQKLHDERMAAEGLRHDEGAYAQKELDRKSALALKAAEVEAKKDGKVPPGYRMTKDGNLEAIPGGPADTKLQGQLNMDTSMLQSSNAAFDRLASSANGLLNHPGLNGITGLRGRIPNVPGSAAADADAQLNTLKSQIGFGVLQEMRNNSKTGSSGLGALSDAEGKRLENNLATLDKAQSIDQMKSSLKNILDYANTAKDRLRDAYNMKHKTGASMPMDPINSKPPELPSGAKQIGTSKGKPVYQLPDGSKVIAE